MTNRLDQKEELELVEAAKEDFNAFSKLYDFYMPQIYGYVLRRVNNKVDAQDLVSQTFEKALNGLVGFEVRNNIRFSSWLYRIASNSIIDFYRQSGKRQEVDFEDVEHTLKDETVSRHTEFMAKEEIQAGLSKLTDEYQQIIVLKFYQDLSNDEIAQVLGISVNNMGVKLYRALKKLKEIMEDTNE